ncbi:exodeoxyribonuclease VII small subunit [Alkalicoccobacillus murimartini]|uniref:exodeoxyribonuclease VII small subunit n=1 Tax=Alkalicoccobacillus murimartini TaxID=171685 RepID=UPI0027D90F97|nr:exodeoxyribonuclease VII small subunit [Alkalicoccobacillus murimartini]
MPLTKKEEAISFEEAMEQLEQVVDKLEQGDVPLEQAIEMFQQGMDLSKQCHVKLEHIEKQMDQILHEDGELEELDLSGEDQE